MLTSDGVGCRAGEEEQEVDFLLHECDGECGGWCCQSRQWNGDLLRVLGQGVLYGRYRSSFRMLIHNDALYFMIEY